MDKKIVIPLSGDKSILLKIKMFSEEEEIDLDRLLRIDASNIHWEIATFPVVLNRVGFLLADCENAMGVSKIDCDVEEARLADSFRTTEVEAGRKPPSNEKVSEHVTKHPSYIAKKKIFLKRVKERDYISSLYWSMKSKDDKLKQLMNTVEAGDMAESLLQSSFRSFNYVDTKILNAKNA